MEKKKSKYLLIIIIILVVILLIVGGLAGVYFFTDIFKSNKQLFFRDMAQTVQSENGFIEQDIIDYLQKKENNSYENEGEVTFDINNSSLSNQQQKLTNALKITFSGKNNSDNSKIEKNVSVDFSDNAKFPIDYRKIDNIIGLKNKYISKKFFTLKTDEKNDNIKVMDKVEELENIEFSIQEIQSIKISYIDNILGKIDNNKFSKINKDNLIGYKLTLTQEEFKNVLKEMLDTLEKDETTLKKLNQALDIFGQTQLDSSQIKKLSDEIDSLEIQENDNVEITVYENNKLLTGLELKIGSDKISINKSIEAQDVSYTITIENTDSTGIITVTTKYTGLSTDNVKEMYEINMQDDNSNSNSDNKAVDNTNNDNQNSVDDEGNNTSNDTEENVESVNETTSNDSTDNDEMSYKYTIVNNVQFKDDVEFEEFSTDNSINLSEKDSEYITKLLAKIGERMILVNQKLMERLGVGEAENPLQNIIPPIFGVQNNAQENVNNTEVTSFNQKFELYESTNTKGATVKGLLTTIQNNNEEESNNKNKIKEINVDGDEYEPTEQNITLLKSNINVDDEYKVEFEKDSDTGLIYRVVINKR